MIIVHADFRGTDIAFSGDGWFNATAAASRYGKDPSAWLSLPDAVQYIEALLARLKPNSCILQEFNEIRGLKSSKPATRAKALRLVKKSGLVRAKAGGVEAGGGTWLHPKLAVPFARWLDVEFAVWCDEQIDKLLRGHGDWRRMRHEAAASHKVMCDVLRISREAGGKETVGYHYANESRLVNRVITGEWGGIDRDALPLETLDLIAKLEVKNSVLLAREVSKEDRIKSLAELAATYGLKALPHAA